MYVIHDSKANKYNAPFFLLNDNVALRMFSDILRDPSTDIYHHPTDFALFKIGDYDDGNAELNTIEPLIISRAHELKAMLEIKEKVSRVPEDIDQNDFDGSD